MFRLIKKKLGLPQKMQEELSHMRGEHAPSPKGSVQDPFDFLHSAGDNDGGDAEDGEGIEPNADVTIVHDISEWMRSVHEGRYL
jgi:hypothetical protein